MKYKYPLKNKTSYDRFMDLIEDALRYGKEVEEKQEKKKLKKVKKKKNI